MASIGLLPSDVEPAATELWGCHVQVISVFDGMSTQWRVGMNGPTGLDYSALPTVLRMRRVLRDDWPEMFNDLRVLESEALDEMHKK